MEFGWTTFLLEIINFLVLVWILKHFFFKPVLEVIDRRRNDIEQQLAKSQRLNEESNALKEEYKNRLVDWEQERQEARNALAQELNEERARQMALLQQQLEQDKQKAEHASSRHSQEKAHEIEYRAMALSSRFAANILGKAAGPELEQRLLTLLVDELVSLSEEQKAAMRLQWGESLEAITVTSAFPLEAAQRKELEGVLSHTTLQRVPVHYAENPQLIAGFCITMGTWILRANVRDDLKGFAEFAHGSR